MHRLIIRGERKMLLKDALFVFKNFLTNKELSTKTIKGYLYDLNCFNEWFVKRYNYPLYLEEITLEQIEEYLLMLKLEKNYQATSRNKIQISFKAFLSYAYKKNLICEDIGSKLQRIKAPRKEMQYLTEEEVIKFAEALENNLYKLAVLTMFYTGVRISELTNLKSDNVDLQKRVIHIYLGKGAKSRIIPICDKLYKLLIEYTDNWKVESPYFFATSRTVRLSLVTLEHAINKTRKKLNWSKKITAHTFRHSFASSLVAKNVNIVNISKLLGHSSLKTTEIYTHTDFSQLKNAVDTI